ncbi:1-deoxy-D-xylulose-5-phosphate synthase [Actinophytocola algeriensis]|uniref:1-deoxy-D-xylulose-5-phosphate synthase n=1 Tax=Actinophytocola algeriensis TaxID=1768010 RepID=A0A7W7PZZ4_9PSEU|nr:1-deoxy-D-xylulose-5-phosphate synthase [Actinophytocola algeriensis]MBB4904339.1 1-deoxy-D-xylulose-5-phosphate synthase [Actinophytocola algeriensis]MBE1476803.1 1-deoxy-D-xylulose-5-phosphate synthase [Actinophytocola algeriensis]
MTDLATLRRMSTPDLLVLAAELRAELVDKVRHAGGHLGPNLGAVELTIALHRVFRSPADVLLFDTGHQAYVHKLLTGRGLDDLRQAGGTSGYPSRTESPHDVIENSHASTALSYADGLAKSFAVTGSYDRRVVAVIGDGALTGGMAWEALNNLGAAPSRPVVVVLNDNGRSYAPTVGGLAEHLAALRSGSSGANLFTALGFSYVGPVDGHDVVALEQAFRSAAALGRPVVVHCRTEKGKGYPPAEEDEADRMHAVGPATSAGGRSWTSVFADSIVAIGEERPDVVCLTAAMALPAGLGGFAARFPARTFDVGIAEQHAVTSAAGLAMGGLHPVVAIYATFLSRAFDQVLMDVALHRLGVTFVLDRAGVTGPDGASHHGMWDASVLPVVPGLRLAAPRDPASLRELLREAVSVQDAPTVLRYPKASAGPDIPAVRRADGYDVLREEPGAAVLLVAVGPLAGACLAAADELARHDVPVTVVDPQWTMPLHPALLRLAAGYPLVLAVEDTTATGALGARLAQALAATGERTCVATFALPAGFLPHASREEILRAHGLDGNGIAGTVLKRLARLKAVVE